MGMGGRGAVRACKVVDDDRGRVGVDGGIGARAHHREHRIEELCRGMCMCMGMGMGMGMGMCMVR